MRSLLTPNRVAALSGVASAVGVGVAAFTGALPPTWQGTAAISVGLLTHAGIVLKFMEGSQRHDSNLAYATSAPGQEAQTTALFSPEDLSGIESEAQAAFAAPLPTHDVSDDGYFPVSAGHPDATAEASA